MRLFYCFELSAEYFAETETVSFKKKQEVHQLFNTFYYCKHDATRCLNILYKVIWLHSANCVNIKEVNWIKVWKWTVVYRNRPTDVNRKHILKEKVNMFGMKIEAVPLKMLQSRRQT